MHKFFKENKILCIMFPLAVLVDQLTKLWAIKYVKYHTIEIIKNFFGFIFVYNEGAAWGMAEGNRILLCGVSLLACVFILIYYFKNKNLKTITKTSLVMIFSGAFGNMIDRIATGKVIDFIEVNIFIIFNDVFPIFNVADLFITFGAILFAISIMFFEEEDGK